MKTSKVKKLVKKRKKHRYSLKPDDIRYIIELANQHPRWSVDRIFEEALRPRMRCGLILPLTPKTWTALEKASKIYQITAADVVYHALEEWLKAKKCLDK